MAAVEYTKQMLDTMDMDSVWLQPCTVPHWHRGEKEIVRVTHSALGSMDLKALALGNSIGTDATGIVAEVIEARSLAEVEALGEAQIKGKIVFTIARWTLDKSYFQCLWWGGGPARFWRTQGG